MNSNRFRLENNVGRLMVSHVVVESIQLRKVPKCQFGALEMTKADVFDMGSVNRGWMQ